MCCRVGGSGVQRVLHSRTGVAGLLPLRHLGSTHPGRGPGNARPACALAFHGTFDHTLDAKNRLTVPSKFRSALAGRVFLVKGADPCLSVYPEATYAAMTEQALAGLTGRDVVVAGAGPCLELWERTAWESYDADLAQRASDLTASLGHPA